MHDDTQSGKGVDQMRQNLLAKMGRLEQRQEVWLCTIRRAPAWITPKRERPYRPFLFMILDDTTGAVLASNMRQEAPTPDVVLRTLAQAMLKPLLGSGGRRRPTEIWLDCAGIAQALAPLLDQIGVRCVHHPTTCSGTCGPTERSLARQRQRILFQAFIRDSRSPCDTRHTGMIWKSGIGRPCLSGRPLI
jgi:hypothetical protein